MSNPCKSSAVNQAYNMWYIWNYSLKKYLDKTVVNTGFEVFNTVLIEWNIVF